MSKVAHRTSSQQPTASSFTRLLTPHLWTRSECVSIESAISNALRRSMHTTFAPTCVKIWYERMC